MMNQEPHPAIEFIAGSFVMMIAWLIPTWSQIETGVDVVILGCKAVIMICSAVAAVRGVIRGHQHWCRRRVIERLDKVPGEDGDAVRPPE